MFDSNGYPLYPSGYCMPSNGYGFSPYPYYQPYIHEELWIHNSLYRPRNVIYNIYGEKEKPYEARKLIKQDGHYKITERNGRPVDVGKMELKDKYIVNQKPDGTFDALYCTVKCEGANHPIPIAIPHKDFTKRNILPYIPFFRRSVDGFDKYIVMAFFQELLEGDDIKFLQLPQHSGWQECNGTKTSFASAEIVIPQLRPYYSCDILERRMIHTEMNFAEAVEALAKLLPRSWKYKLLLAVRVTSLLLYFYQLSGLTPDQIVIVEPKSESNAKAAITLLKNKNYNTNTCPLTENRTKLQHELCMMNDGVALFRDASYVEDYKKRDAGLDVLVHDLHNSTGDESRSRHMTVVISDTPGNISSEIPAYFVSLQNCPDIDNIGELQQAVGEFDSALIRLLSNSEVTDNLVTNGLRKTTMNKTERNSEYHMSWRMLRTTVELLYDYQVISPDEKKEIIRYLKNSSYEMPDTDQAITNDFRRVLSECIVSGRLCVANQVGPPYFDREKPMVFYDGKYINIMASVLDTRILPMLKVTRKRNKLLAALKACGKLYSNNNYKRNLDVAVAPGVKETVSVYSFPKDILTAKGIEKINALAYADYSFMERGFPDGFVPIVYTGGSDKVAGRVIDDTTDEAESIYASGQTRSGKTKFLVEQAIIRAEAGNKIIIIDQTGAFAPEELKKHVPSGIVEERFSHWKIGEKGVPIDLLSLENCSTFPEKKRRLYSIFSVAASITGEVQGKVLKKRFTEIAKAIDAGDISFLSETLDFFDEEDSEQAKIKDRLEEMFEELEGLNVYEQNWGEFLDSQKKIVVLSTSADGIQKGSQLVDMLLASLYEYKQHDRNPRYTIILDEIEDLCLEKDGPVSAILRKGAKHRLSILMASQEFSVEKDRLGKLIGNCGIQVFFRPKDANLSDIAKHIGVNRASLVELAQGQCVVYGPLYNKSQGKNKQITLVGRTYQHKM